MLASLLFAILTQLILFVPFALSVSISYTVLRATDMTLDGSFVLGAAVFAKMVSLGLSPVYAALLSLLAGGFTGMMVGLIQRGGKIDPLLAGILAAFILMSLNLIIMGKPNISLLNTPTLLSKAFNLSDSKGYLLTAVYSLALCVAALLLLHSRFGLTLRGLGDNAMLLNRLGKPIETYRMAGFAFTNTLSAASGMLTAQVVGYADTSMGFGMTLTGIGAIIIGQQLIGLIKRSSLLRTAGEFTACLLGSSVYFFTINSLLRININPVYIKMILGIVLIMFIRKCAGERNQ